MSHGCCPHRAKIGYSTVSTTFMECLLCVMPRASHGTVLFLFPLGLLSRSLQDLFSTWADLGLIQSRGALQTPMPLASGRTGVQDTKIAFFLELLLPQGPEIQSLHPPPQGYLHLLYFALYSQPNGAGPTILKRFLFEKIALVALLA